MSNLTKKFTGFFFILLGFIPMLFVLIFILKQQSVKHHMKERMEEEYLHSVVLADNDVKWTEPGKELLIEGRMFDVESVEYKNGTTIVTGLFDDEETNLNHHFGESWKKRSAQENNILAQVFQCLRGFYFSSPNNIVIEQPKQEFGDMLYSSRLLNQFKLILTPPPQAS